MAQGQRGSESVLVSNERTTDGLVVKALWMAFLLTAPLIGAVYMFVLKSDPTPYLKWVAITTGIMLVPSLIHRFRWLRGSVKYLGPLAAAGALVALAFTIHVSETAWAVWLLPTAMAALYFQSRIVWIANVLTWIAIPLSIWANLESFPDLTAAGVAYFALTMLSVQAVMASVAGKAARLLGRVEEESGARESAYAGLQAAAAEVLNASKRLVEATEELEADSAGAAAFLDGAFADTVAKVVTCSRQQQARVSEATQVMEELNRSIGSIASGAQADAAAVARGTSLVDGMAAGIHSVSRRAETVMQVSHRAADVAAKGSEAVTEMVQGISRMRSSADSAASVMRGLREHSQRIGGIADTIAAIAGQTNMLALNAAIEAARVGEHGKGFAVVAQEVRSLAERSAVQARGIAELLEQIRDGVDQAASAVDTTSVEVDSGSKLAGTAREALEEVLGTTTETAAQVGAIATETRQLSGSAQELVNSFHQIEAVVQDNSSASEEMAAASEQVLSGVAAIGDSSAGNLTAAEGLERGAGQLRGAMGRIAGVSEDLSKLAGRLEGLMSRIGGPK